MELFPFQKEHARILQTTLNTHGIAIDTSHTGAGKTAVAAHIAKTGGYSRILACSPKVVITYWLDTFEGFGINSDIAWSTNYEQLKKGRAYKKGTGPEPVEWLREYSAKKNCWNLGDSKTLVIVDEFHKCKNDHTQITKYLCDLKQGIKDGIVHVLCLSATLGTNLDDLISICYLTGLLKSNTKQSYTLFKKYNTFEKVVDSLRIYISQMVSPLEEPKYVGIEHPIPSDVVADLNKEDYSVNHLANNKRMCMKIEMMRAQIAVKHLKSSDKYKWVFFTNYIATQKCVLNQVCALYPEITYAFINGDQTLEERNDVVKRYHQDEVQLLICTISAGGIGLSLQATHKKKVQSFVFYEHDGLQMTQTIGRVHRVGQIYLPRIYFVKFIPMNDGDVINIEVAIQENILNKVKNIKYIHS